MFPGTSILYNRLCVVLLQVVLFYSPGKTGNPGESYYLVVLPWRQSDSRKACDCMCYSIMPLASLNYSGPWRECEPSPAPFPYLFSRYSYQAFLRIVSWVDQIATLSLKFFCPGSIARYLIFLRNNPIFHSIILTHKGKL